MLAEIHAQPFIALDRSGHYESFGRDNVTAHIDDALNRARQRIGLPMLPGAPRACLKSSATNRLATTSRRSALFRQPEYRE